MLINNYLNQKGNLSLKTKLEDLISYEPEEIINNPEKLNSQNINILEEFKNETNLAFEEIIINTFENKFLLYFDNIKTLEEKSKEKLFPKYFQNINNESLIVFDMSLKIFKQTIIFLDETSVENNNEIILGKLYSISYVKLYLYKLVGFSRNDISKIDEFKDIFEIINDIKNRNFKFVIYIYILKLYYYNLDNDFELLNYVFDAKLYNFFDDDFYTLFKGKSTIITNYYLFPLGKDKYQNYLRNLKVFENIKRDKFSDEEKTKKFILDLLNKKDIDTFLIISINKIFFELYINYDEKKLEGYKNYFINIELIVGNNFKENEKLLNLFYNSNIFLKNIFPLIKDKNLLEILLYGFRFCIQSLCSENNIINNNNNCQNKKEEKFFYKSLFSEDYIESLNNTYIPGIDIPEYLHLVTLETIIDHLNTKPDRHGCYVCSCGYYYDIDPCGFPTKNRTFDCPVCGLKIGWGPKPVKAGEETHGMVIRPGHLRIFKDQKAKKYQMRVFDEVDENIPNMILDDYIKNVIEPIRNKNNFGLAHLSKNFFEKKNKKIRNLTQIGYRLLSYIFYCHLFYSYQIGNISENNLKDYLVENMSLIDIIETNWNLLKEALKEKCINNIQIFLNLIFDDISVLMKNCKLFYTPEEREKFEDEIEKIILKYIEKYDDLSDKYIEENKLQIKFQDYYNIETIVSELIPINEDIYNKKEYPMLKYFIMTKYKSKIDCLNHIQDKNKYSLTYQLLSDKKDFLILKYLPIFNDFINYMNKKYSFKITREEAHKRKLKEEIIFKNPEFNSKFNNFIQIWKEIKYYAIKYKCTNELPIKDLSAEDYLSYFLNDVSEYGYGMYLASICQSFIELQNSFLKNIIENNTSQENILYKYINDLKNKIGVNEANNNQILLIKERFKKSGYKNIDEIIYKYSERNIDIKNNKINYNEYNNFIYNYDKIENELGKIILPGIQMFKNEDDLELIIFWGEGFKGKRSQILIEFNMKYSQNEINSDEKNIIMKYIKEKLNANKNIIKEYFALFQMLIIDLTTKKIININTPLIPIIKTLSLKYEFNPNLIEFITNNEKIFTIDKIMNIYTIFEHLCFNDLLLLLKDEYKKEIDENKKDDIIKKFNSNNIYSKKDLASAVRRLISRYLVGTGDLNDIRKENDLCFELSRADLWNKNIRIIDDLDIKIKEHIGNFELKVEEALSFYELIGNEDKEEIEKFFK